MLAETRFDREFVRLNIQRGACRWILAFGIFFASASTAAAGWQTELVEGIVRLFKGGASKVHPHEPVPHSVPVPPKPLEAPLGLREPANSESVMSGRDIAINQGVRIGGKKVKESLESNCSELRRISIGEEIVVVSETGLLFADYPRAASPVSFELSSGAHFLVVIAILEPRINECALQVMSTEATPPKIGFLIRQTKAKIYRLEKD